MPPLDCQRVSLGVNHAVLTYQTSHSPTDFGMTLEAAIGYFFFDKSLLRRALTRSAYALEHPQEAHQHQAAYAVLGSYLLRTVLTELWIRAGHETEADLTMQRLAWEFDREAHILSINEKTGLSYVIKFGQDEKQRRAYNDPQVLMECLEAVLGAIYFDGGFSAARKAIQKLFGEGMGMQ